MNNDILQDKWQQIRGEVKHAFGKLTEDDLEQANGAVDKMLGSLQARYGYTKAKAKIEWDAFIRKYGDIAEDAQQQAQSAVDIAQTQVDNAVEQIKATVERMQNSSRD